MQTRRSSLPHTTVKKLQPYQDKITASNRPIRFYTKSDKLCGLKPIGMTNLAQLLQFDQNDLAANRKGYLTQAQHERLSQGQASALTVSLFMGAAVVISLFAGVLFGGLVLAVCGSLSLLGGLLTLIEIYSGQHSYGQDLDSGQVESIQGRVVVRQKEDLHGTGYYYDLSVGDIRFRLNEVQAQAFATGDTYILYYTPRSRVLLSAERITHHYEAQSLTLINKA